MDTLSLIPALRLPVAQLASLVSRAYADYYYRVSVTEAQLSQICLEEDVDLEQSVVAMCNDHAVGLALLSRRAERGWISAVGVLPAHRHRGIARLMIQALQRRAAGLGLRTVTLEVLVENRAGLALYAQLGFTWRRNLFMLVLEPHSFSARAAPEGIAVASPEALLYHFAAFHPVFPSWQREYATLRHRSPHLSGLSYEREGRCLGYTLFQPQRSYQLIHDLAVSPEAPAPLEIAASLLAAVHNQRPRVGGYVINVVEDDPLLPAYTALRYQVVHRQHELIWRPDDALLRQEGGHSDGNRDD